MIEYVDAALPSTYPQASTAARDAIIYPAIHKICAEADFVVLERDLDTGPEGR